MSAARPAPDRTLHTFSLATKLLLAFEIVRTFATVRRQMRGEPNVAELLVELRRGVLEPPSIERPEEIWFARRIGAVVRRVVVRLPGDTRCLARSLVLVAILARRGVGTTLVIGVRSAPQFGAHAWVELAGNPLLEPIEAGASRLAEL